MFFECIGELSPTVNEARRYYVAILASASSGADRNILVQTADPAIQ